MFARSTGLNFILSAVFVFVMGACGNLGGCGACGSTGDLPPGGLPKDQTLEGGAQIRLTADGFDKLESILPAMLNDQLDQGFCLPRGEVGRCQGGFLATGACYCASNNGPSCNQGCQIDVTLNRLTPRVTSQQTLNLDLSTTVQTTVHIIGQVIGIGFSCTLGVSSPDLHGDFDIAFGIKPDTGELDIHLADIHEFRLNLDFSGCGPLSDIGDFLSDFIDSFIGQFIIRLLRPAIDDILQDLIPSPLGIAGMLDVGKLLEKISPGTDGFMEARLVPGGYVNLQRSGLSLGMITGLNSDEDPLTRGPTLDSEPHLCVPPFEAPNFGAPPANLPLTARSTYALGVANEFNGLPEAPGDIRVGISETTLDLAGHHAVTSGMMCLGVGTSFINQLNVGTIGLLAPSVAELTENPKDPLMLVTRPQRPLDFKIGDNTEQSPALTIGIENLEVDFYAFLYERYTRVFTVDLTMNVGVNLEFEQPPNMPAVIKPTLVGIAANKVTVRVLNNQFVEEKKERLEMVLPSIFDLVTPLLGSLPDVKVPDFAGLQLQDLSIAKVHTTQDDFLAINARLGANQLMLQRAQTDARWAAAVAKLGSPASRVMAPERSTGVATLARVTTPEPAKIRAALYQQELGQMPEVAFDVDRVDARGRELEWAYRLGNGMWRPYRTIEAGGQLVIRDRAFAWQGKYEIGLKSRAAGDYRTVSEEKVTPVVIDSAGPRILDAQARWEDSTWHLPIIDAVSDRLVQYALGKPGATAPESAWFQGGYAELERAELEKYAVDKALTVFARDEVGNMTIALVAPFHGQPGEGGCDCSTGSPGAGLVLVLVVGFVVLGRRRVVRFARHRVVVSLATWVGLSAALSLAPGCDCGNEQSCETVSDCGDFCGPGELPFCIDNTCVCSDDVIPGRIGPYSDVAVGPSGEIWVSAYAASYGDLVAARVEPGPVPDEAWEWIDGVPDGPVVVENSKYRNGIVDKGADVGMYTSIAVAPDGTPMIAYFERETASLKFAMKKGDAWQTHTIDVGTKKLGELSGKLVGMYTSLTLRTDDGRPGIAYLTHISDAQGVRAEVRYASAQVPFPQGPADWQGFIVDSAPLPPDDPSKPDVYPLPGALGLFIDSARLRNQAPVLVYYDRAHGDLKLAKFNATTGRFNTPVILDGSTTDAGWSPSIAVDANDVVHVAYVGASGDDLKYITDAAGSVSKTIDNGYRIVGQTVDGLPKPEFHFVGDDASLVLANGGTLPMVAYQDATSHELLLATQQQSGEWQRISVAGATDPWPGAYGFFASDAVTANSIIMSTWVVKQPARYPERDNWVEIFTRQTVIQ